MNTLFTKPTRLSVTVLVLFWAILILFALFTSGCKTRKVDRDQSESSKISSEAVKVVKADSVKNISGKTTIKVEESKDSTGVYTKKTTVFFEPTDKIPAGAIKEVTEESWSRSNRNNKVQSQIDEFAEHSEIKSLDSTAAATVIEQKKQDIKKIEAKPNTLKNWLGAGLFVLVLCFVGYFSFYRK